MSELKPAPQVKCSWDGCFKWSITRSEIEPGKGFHHLCEEHYVEAHHRVSARRTAAKGLRTPEEMRAYCRSKFAQIVEKMQFQPERVPGEDDA